MINTTGKYSFSTNNLLKKLCVFTKKNKYLMMNISINGMVSKNYIHFLKRKFQNLWTCHMTGEEKIISNFTQVVH